MVTASADRTARLWDVPTISDNDSKDVLLLADLAEACGGLLLKSWEELEFLDVQASRAREIRRKISTRFSDTAAELTPLQEFLKWNVSDPRTRTISPFFDVTVGQWIENRISEGTLDGLRAAIQVDPANARLAGHFGRALADYALAKGTDPDAARRARGDADFQTRRALRLAPANEDVKKLRAEVVNLLKPVTSIPRGCRDADSS